MTGVVCDDRPGVRRMVTGLLLRCGYDAAVAVDGVADLRRTLAEVRPVVAVVALPMLGLGGLAAVTRLLDEHPGLRLVLLSGFETLAEAAEQAGATALVPEEDPMLLHVHLLGVLAAVGGPAEVVLPGVPAQEPVGAASVPAPSVAPPTGTVSTNPSA